MDSTREGGFTDMLGVQDIMIVDNFLENPMVVRNNAIQEGFKDLPFQGSIYHTVNVNIPTEVIDGIEKVYARPIQMHVAAFRQGKKNSPIHNLVHADNSCAKMAAVLYLNKPEDCIGGTAFWTHKKTGWTRMPSMVDLQEAGYTLETFSEDWHKADEWELTSLCEMVFNRIVFYPTDLFHSRYPFSGFGNNDVNARLVACMFFDVI